MLRWLLPIVVLTAPFAAEAQAPERDQEAYRAVQAHLSRGWNTWHNRSVLAHVLLPEGLILNLAFKQHRWLAEPYLREALIGRRGEDRERITPGLHTWDGSFTSLRLRWEQLDVTVESAHDGDDLVVLITPAIATELPVKLVLEAGFLWNRPGTVERADDRLRARAGGRTVDIFATAEAVADPYVESMTPHRVMVVDGAIGISTGRARSVETIRKLIDGRRRALLADVEKRYGDLAEAYLAVMSGIAWNTIYEPMHDRVISTVGRLWNVEYGGYSMFGWDNFFFAYATSLDQRELAIANVIEHLHGLTEEGFIPNDNGGNGRKSWDHSQPPVGGIMVREVYRRYPERWFLEMSFDALLSWNRWWPKRRLNRGLLAYGSHQAKNPFREGHRESMVAAGYESGMDDSPMYEDVPFDSTTSTMALQDVGLNSLYIADCRALAELAAVLGRTAVQRELRGACRSLRGAHGRPVARRDRAVPEPSDRHRRAVPPPVADALLSPSRPPPRPGARGADGERAPARPADLLGRAHPAIDRAQRSDVSPSALLEGRHLAAPQFLDVPQPAGVRLRVGAHHPGGTLARHVPARVAPQGLRQRELLVDHRHRRRRAPVE